jgi:hypothetical protein
MAEHRYRANSECGAHGCHRTFSVYEKHLSICLYRTHD